MRPVGQNDSLVDPSGNRDHKTYLRKLDKHCLESETGFGPEGGLIERESTVGIALD